MVKTIISKKTITFIISVALLLSALVYNILYINDKKNEIIDELVYDELIEDVSSEIVAREESKIDNKKQSDKTTENTKLIDINTATKEELKSLEGIGDVIANRIIEYRNKKNGFKEIKELKQIDGIGDKKYEKIEKYIIAS